MSTVAICYTLPMRESHPGRRFLLLLLAGCGILAFLIFWPFFAPLVFAIVFAVVLQPLYKSISLRLPRWPSISALLTVLIATLCILVPLGLLGTHLASQAQQVYTSFVTGEGQMQVQRTILSVEQGLLGSFPVLQGFSNTLSADISAYGKQALQWAVEHLGTVFSGITSLFFSLFIFFVALYYLLRDGERFKTALVELSPLPDKYDERVFERLGMAVNSVITGSLLVALIQGTLAAIGFSFFGLPNSILWGTVAAIAALVPGIGTALVFIPAIIFLFVTGNTGATLGLTVWWLLAVGTIDNFLGPRLMSRGIKLHPFFVLLSVIGGISFFGIPGLFLGPIFLSFLFALLSIYAAFPDQPASPPAQ